MNDMKHISIILLWVFSFVFSLECVSQVKIVDVSASNNKPDEVQLNVPVYDSLYNITFPDRMFEVLDANRNRYDKATLEKMAKEYLLPFIGQKIYIYPITEEYCNDFYEKYGYKLNIKSKNKHRGKYYTLVDIPEIGLSEYEGKYTVRYIYLQLVDDKGKKIKGENVSNGILESYMWDFNERLGDYLCVGYYEKLKEIMIGKWYIAKGRGPKARPLDGQSEVLWGHFYQCVDIAVVQNDMHYELDLFLRDRNGVTLMTAATSENLSLLQEESAYNDSIRIEREKEAERIRQNQIRMEEERIRREEVARQKAIQDSIQQVNDSIQLAQRKTKIIKKYGKYYGNLILEGKVVRGMTKEMCKESWGEPDDINVSIGSWGRHEQWVYEHKYMSDSYLYFENGKLTTIQN